MHKRIAISSILGLVLTTSLACNTVFTSATLFNPPTEKAAATDIPTEAPPPTPTATSELFSPDNPYPGADSIGDPYFEGMGNGGYDVQHYDLILDVDMAENALTATAKIDIKATQELSSLNFDFIGLLVDDVSVNGQSAEYQRGFTELTIFLPEFASEGDLVEIEIAYHGHPGESATSSGGLSYSDGWIPYEGGLLVAGEPIGASTWYPVNEHPSDKATYSYTISVEAPYIVAANGVLQGVEVQGSTRTYSWVMNDPIAPYLTTVGIAEFDVVESSGPNGLPIRTYFGKDLPDHVRQDFARQGEMIEFYETVFGPYPFEAAGAVVHDVDLNFALETATMIVFGNGFTEEYVVAHEMAHMWFGDAVGLEKWQDIWLNEGFATYASQLWTEEAYSRAAMEEEVRSNYQLVASMPVSRIRLVGDPGSAYLFDGISIYIKGALVLHALRLEIGDEAFFESLQSYVEQYEGGNASIDDFIAVTEEVSGGDLDAFFDAWLFERTLPDIPQMNLYAEDFP